MRLGVWLLAGGVFLTMLLLDTQAVVQLGWMTVAGRLGVWPQRMLGGVVLAAVAGRLVAAGLGRLRRRKARPVRRQAAVPGKAARKGTQKPKGHRPAAPARVPGRPSRA